MEIIHYTDGSEALYSYRTWMARLHCQESIGIIHLLRAGIGISS